MQTVLTLLFLLLPAWRIKPDYFKDKVSQPTTSKYCVEGAFTFTYFIVCYIVVQLM